MNLNKCLKKVLTMLFTFTLIFTSSIFKSIYAYDDSSDLKNSYPLITQKLELFFEHQDKFKIYDSSGDVSKVFYNHTYEYYYNNNMNKVIDYFINENYTIVESLNNIQLLYNENVTKRSELCYTVLKKDNVATSAEFAYYVTGRASFNEGQGKYVSMSPPGISIYHLPAFDDYGVNVTGDYGMKDNNRRVYYKNIVITLWGTVSSDTAAVKIHYDPIMPGITLEF